MGPILFVSGIDGRDGIDSDRSHRIGIGLIFIIEPSDGT